MEAPGPGLPERFFVAGCEKSKFEDPSVEVALIHTKEIHWSLQPEVFISIVLMVIWTHGLYNLEEAWSSADLAPLAHSSRICQRVH